MASTRPFLLPGIFGATGVALGAFGAHALKTRLADTGTTEVWRTAVTYHLVHAIALFALANGVLGANAGLPRAVRLLWSLGILCFSGSLYLLALGGPLWLGPITPLGGIFFIAGWICAACARLPNLPSSKS